MLWGKGEDLLWYCNWGTTQNTILAKEYAGDTVLYGKLLRTLAAGKPYVINKYDFYRPRNMMAEAAALGYATNAIATPWQNEEDRAVVLRYFDFLKQARRPVSTGGKLMRRSACSSRARAARRRCVAAGIRRGGGPDAGAPSCSVRHPARRSAGGPFR